MFAHQGARCRLHLTQQHAIPPQIGQMLQRGARLLRVQHPAVQHAMLQHQAPVAGKVHILHLDVGIEPPDIVVPRQ